MAPSFDTLSDHDFQDDLEEEIDFSDLREQYDVRMEEGLDTFCVSFAASFTSHRLTSCFRLSTAYHLSTQNRNRGWSNSFSESSILQGGREKMPSLCR